MLYSLAYASAIIVATALPVCAQNLTEKQARDAAQALVDDYNRNYKAKNAAGIAAIFTEDTLRVWPSGAVSVNRAEIEKRFARMVENFDMAPLVLEHIKIVTDNVIVAFGSFSGTSQGKDGPVREIGHWAWTEAHSGDGWKISASMVSAQPPQGP